MKITNSAAASAADQAQAVRAAAVTHPDKPVPPVRRTDNVRLSDAGRAMAERAQPVRQDPGAELSTEEIAEIRQRIVSGAYNSLEMVDAVARRILAEGDLTAPQGDDPAA